MNIPTQSTLLKLKALLNQVSDISYGFNRLNKEYPIDSLTEKKAQEIITVYIRMLNDLIAVMENYEQYQKSRMDKSMA